MNCLKRVSLSVAALAISATVFAASDMETRVRDLEKEMKQVRTETIEKTFGARTASARPPMDTSGFFLSFDVLYWQAKTGGTEYCYTNSSLTPASTAVLPITGNVKELDFSKWDWGFRVGAGYNFEHGDWDIYANYTYFTDNNSTITTAATVHPVNFRHIVSNTLTATGVTKATSQLKFGFNRIDVELGRDFFVERYLSLRPHIGLMTAWITQNQRSQYTGGDLGLNTVTVKQNNSYWGIGPRMGMNTKWFSCNGFSILGNVSGGLPYGRFDMDYDQEFSIDSETNDIDLDGDMHRFTPTVQMQLGFGYDRTVSCDNQISVFLAWDIQYWWRASQHIVRELDYARLGEDMSLQGLTFHIQWGF